MDSFTLDKIEFDAVRRIVAEYCSCSLGRNLALRIKPSRHLHVVRRWLAQVSQMSAARAEVGPPPLGGITDIAEPLARAVPSGGAGGEDFALIASTLEGAGNVAAYLLALPETEFGDLRALAEPIPDFTTELAAIRAIVAPDGQVLDDASPKLRALRLEIESTAERIHEVIYGYLRQQDVTRLLQSATVTLHGDRYVLPVKVENRGRLPGVVHRESQSGATVFVEPIASVELNNRLSDLRDDERREVQRLLNTLAVRVQARLGDIQSALRGLAAVDLVSAKAQYSCQFEMTCPMVTDEGPLQISQARHPLLLDQAWRQQQAGTPASQRHTVVPIDVRLGDDFDLLLITGSNTGGKTVTLKTTALLAAMAQSGMHIPAQRGSRLPLLEGIYIDVGDEQSLQQSLSTFGAHITRIRHILSQAGRRTLVLLDELGSGTDPDEGGAIGQAVLDELRRIGCLGMVTTHLSVLKAYAINHDRVDNASVEFNTETMRPTYHLLIGMPGESHAISVAARLGLPKRIVAAARNHFGSRGSQFRKALKATGEARQQAEEARAEAQNALVAAEVRQEQYEAKLADVEQLKRDFETWLATLTHWKAGDEIFIPSLHRTGKLVRLELHQQRALVDVDAKAVEVSLRQLMPDLGQQAVREQVARLRQQLAEQSAAAQQALAQAEDIRKQARREAELQKLRAKQFDRWLSSIGRLKVGDEVPIARKPGQGKVTAVNLPGLRATVETAEGVLELSIQDLFPQTGPFAPPEARVPHRPRPQAQGQAPQEPPPDKPIVRRSAESKAARRSATLLASLPSGAEVFVVPFNKRATLLRLNADKGVAVVQSGIFEMQVPLADIEPVQGGDAKAGGGR